MNRIEQSTKKITFILNYYECHTDMCFENKQKHLASLKSTQLAVNENQTEN